MLLALSFVTLTSSIAAAPGYDGGAPAPVLKVERALTVPNAKTVTDAVRDAHCATLHTRVHPKRATLGLGARVCLRPGDTVAIEERGVVDVGAGTFSFVRRALGPFDFDHEDNARATQAHDPVSSALRDRAFATQLFDELGDQGERQPGAHPLYTWRARWHLEGDVMTEAEAAMPLLAWSASGRYVAVQFQNSGHWKERNLERLALVFDTRTLQPVLEHDMFGVRFVGDDAILTMDNCEQGVTWHDVVASAPKDCSAGMRARVHFAPPATLRVLPWKEEDADEW